VLLLAFSGLAQNAPPPRRSPILPDSLTPMTVNRSARVQFSAPDAVPPLTWSIVAGALPPGLSLGRDNGVLSGTPTAAGDYVFTVQVRTASPNAPALRREYKLRVNGNLNVRWRRPPAVNGREISGDLIVSNYTTYDVDLTVIVVGVNQIGRATTLGYQHFMLARAASAERPSEQSIPFSGTPGGGVYVVHADAVGEVPSIRAIYRDRIESGKLTITAVP
jgi:hypothetical protein